MWAAGDGVGGDHWEPAARLGAAVARSILGLDVPPAPPASFWSDQYGIRIQLVGSAAGADAVEIDGSPEERSFAAALRRRGVLCGALLVGRPLELPTWRRRLADATTERRPHDIPAPRRRVLLLRARDCAAVAPGVFRVGEIAVVTGSGPDELVLEAARACPAMAIEVIDEATGAPSTSEPGIVRAWTGSTLATRRSTRRRSG